MASIQTKKLIASVVLGLVTAAALAVVQATPLLLFADPLAGEQVSILRVEDLQVGQVFPELQGQRMDGERVWLPGAQHSGHTLIAILPATAQGAINWKILQSTTTPARIVECYPSKIQLRKSRIEQLQLTAPRIPRSWSDIELFVLDPKGILRYRSGGIPDDAEWEKIRHLIEGVD
ncbi:MAG: hypothetical protein KDC44_24450 [Phaeodactylibacter sp.]|nr:hypothetical protein [Phaeodactylibacter sp.]